SMNPHVSGPRVKWPVELGICLIALSAAVARSEPAKVVLARTPNGGIQPQAVTDASGAVHLVYFKGEPSAGDIFYVRLNSRTTSWPPPLRVNQTTHAPSPVTIRGAQLALGRNGRVHVGWNGSKPSDQHRGPPMLYARMNDAGTAFEPERDLMTRTAGLDGGG